MKKRNHTVRAVALTASVLFATGGLISTSASAAIAPTTAGASPGTIEQGALPIESIASIRIIGALSLVTGSQQLLATSLNHTMSDDTRQTLATAIAATNSDLTGTLDDIGRFTAGSSANQASPTSSEIARFVAKTLRDLNALSADQSDLTAASNGVQSSEAARTTQLQEAARLAAETYSEVVWTSGFQAQIDACRGAVNLTGSYHVSVIGEEWQCGGARFPGAGKLVRLSGIMSGLYRVGPVVAVLNAYVDKAADIPRGYALLYQTCRNGDAHTETFTELIPVG